MRPTPPKETVLIPGGTVQTWRHKSLVDTAFLEAFLATSHPY